MAGAPIKFKTASGAPLVIEVTGRDGVDYQIRAQMVIMGVDEDDSQVTPEGFPVFGVQATLALQTVKKGGE